MQDKKTPLLTFHYRQRVQLPFQGIVHHILVQDELAGL
jgi:hypothetical protein